MKLRTLLLAPIVLGVALVSIDATQNTVSASTETTSTMTNIPDGMQQRTNQTIMYGI